MANDATYELGTRLSNRIASACKLHGINTEVALKRVLGEEISRGYRKHLVVPHVLKGGHIHPQTVRQTSDLDVLFARPMQAHEIHAAFEAMRPNLEAKGLDLFSYSTTPIAIGIGGDCGERYNVVAMAGKSEIKTHVDIVGGSHLFPLTRQGPRHGSVFFRDQEALFGHFQPMEAHIADKLLAVGRPDSTRWKDILDLAMLADMDTSPMHVAAEVAHQLGRKVALSKEMMALMPEVPAAMVYDTALAKGRLWAAKKGVEAWEETLVKARNLYAKTREMVPLAHKRLSESRQARQNRMPPELRERIEASAKAKRAERDGNVVELAAWRGYQPGYRPRGL